MALCGGALWRERASDGRRVRAAPALRYRDSFRELGIDVEDASGELLGADDLMREVARAMGSLESETAKVALAQRLMGRSGAALLPLLNGGAEGAEALLARFEELGGGMGEDFVRNSEAAADALTDWDTATLGIKATLANSFLPTLTRILNGLAEWGAGVGELLRGSNVLEIALYSLAGVLGLVAASLLTIMAPVLVPLGILVLLVDDVTAAFQGGTSAIGTFVDELFGVGATAAVVQTVTDAWNALAEAIRSAYAAMTGNLDGGRARDVVDRGEENAARSGRIMGRPGEGYEAALARTNATRARLGLEPVGAEGGGARRGPRVAAEEVRALTGAPTVSSRSAGGPRATEITQHIGAPSIQMTINGAQDPEATSRAVQRALGDALRRTMGEAAATLPQGAAT